MVTQFPLDTMHSVYHGGVKSFFNQLFFGTKRFDNALPFPTRSEMRKQMDIFINLSPCEFQSSRLSSLNYLNDYKAAVERHFLNYVVLPLFVNNVESETYNLVVALVVAVFLLGGASPTPIPKADIDLARDLLDYFVKVALHRHYSKCATPGMHMLLHVADDCENLGCHMDYLGAWPFENGMKIILHSRKSNHRAIQQILRREMESLNCQLPVDSDRNILSLTPLSQFTGFDADKLHPKEPKLLINYHGKKTVIIPKSLGGYRLKANVKDAFCVVSIGARAKDFVIVQCTDFFIDPSTTDGGIIAVGHPYKKWSDIFSKPKPSHIYQVYRFRDKQAQQIKFRTEKILTKLYVLPDLKECLFDMDLNEKFQYSNVPYPKADIWAAKNLANYPVWFGTGLRHIAQEGASLY
jgi:hypothetical protein